MSEVRQAITAVLATFPTARVEFFLHAEPASAEEMRHALAKCREAHPEDAVRVSLRHLCSRA